MAAIQGLDSRVSRPRMTWLAVDFTKRMGEGEADGEDGGGVEGGFAGDGANAVGAEELAGIVHGGAWSLIDNVRAWGGGRGSGAGGVSSPRRVGGVGGLAELCLAYCGTPGNVGLTVVDIEEVPIQILYGELSYSPRLQF